MRLFHLGVEQAIEVSDANGNGRLEAGDHIGFYAAPVPEAYRKYTGENLYWLVTGGGAGALRMQPTAGAPGGGPLAASHEFTFRRAAGETGFRRLTQEPLNALAFTDTPPTGLAAEGAWQYALTSVDSDGLESVLSAAAGLTPNPNQESEPSQSVAASGSGGGCFVSVAAAGMLMALIALPAVIRARSQTARNFGRPAPAAGSGLRQNPSASRYFVIVFSISSALPFFPIKITGTSES